MLRTGKLINMIDFQHVEFRKRLKVDSILEDWKPPEVKSWWTIISLLAIFLRCRTYFMLHLVWDDIFRLSSITCLVVCAAMIEREVQSGTTLLAPLIQKDSSCLPPSKTTSGPRLETVSFYVQSVQGSLRG